MFRAVADATLINRRRDRSQSLQPSLSAHGIRLVDPLIALDFFMRRPTFHRCL
jgi:hypothetical protein